MNSSSTYASGQTTRYSPRQTGRYLRYFTFFLFFALAACGKSDAPKLLTKSPEPLSCAQLANFVIPASAIGLPTNGAQVDSTELKAAAGTGAKALGEYCKVLGSIRPIDSKAPVIRFQIHLPVKWNQKTMMFGGGGYDGVLDTFINVVHGGPSDKLTPLGRGYAVFNSDSGHELKKPFTIGRDASFATNEEALRNFAFEALKKTRDAVQPILQAHYRAPVQKAYFLGGSTGGKEAMFVSQKWPEDYDGVISLFPVWNFSEMLLQHGRIARAFAQPNAYLNQAQRKLIYDAGLAHCDKLDGVADGIISNVNACNLQFDPDTASIDGTLAGPPLRCAAGIINSDTCLNDAQIAALKTMASRLDFKFALGNGETHYPGFNVWGADLGIFSTKEELRLNEALGLNTLAPANPITEYMPYGAVMFDQWLRYIISRDVNLQTLQIDPQNPLPWTSRISDMSLLLDANQTDLSRFRDKGGKLLLVHGSADALVSVRATALYVERVQATMGAAKTEDFLRYYEVPGYGHSFSSAFNLEWDSVTALEDWVERGIAPSNQIAFDKTGVPGRSRPLCPFKTWPRYIGGDVNLAASFQCVPS